MEICFSDVTVTNFGLPRALQSQAQGHFGSLSAIWSPNNDL